MSFSIDKVTTGTYNFVPVIWNVADVGVWILGKIGSVLQFPSLVVLLINTQFLDQVKISSISQLINGIFRVLQKLLKCFNTITILTASFVRLAVITLPAILAWQSKNFDS